MEKELNILDKLRLVIGKDLWSTNDLNGQINSIRMSDGPLGLRKVLDVDNWEQQNIVPSISYPSTANLAKTFDKNLAYLYGEAIANDCIENNIDMILGPGVNIKRNPLCGRNFEYFSEDPLLAGTLAYYYIKGVEDHNVGTSLKHFCCNNEEYSRLFISSEVSEKALNEIYLKPFKIALEAKPMSVMISYNLVNGVKMSENCRLFEKLRNDFHFEGLIISDWDACFSSTKSINAGLNLIMPYNEKLFNELMESYNQKRLNEDSLNNSVKKIFDVISKVDLNKERRKVTLTIKEREDIALKIACDSIVLLKNSKNILPLKNNETILLTGAPIKHHFCGGGSSEVKLRTSFLSLDEALLEEGVKADFSESWWENNGGTASMCNIKHTMSIAPHYDVVIVGVGNNHNVESEGHDRDSFELSKNQLKTIELLKQNAKKLITIVYTGAPCDLKKVSKLSDAVILAGFGGEFINKALSKIILGKINPSGRLSETYPKSIKDIPSLKSLRNESIIKYDDDIFVGYRYYETFNKKVLYPFGYGLSYSKFKYNNLCIRKLNDSINIQFDITNISNLDGKEVVQIYYSIYDQCLNRPKRELVYFDKVKLESKESIHLDYNIPLNVLTIYDENLNQFILHEGKYIIEICKNSHEVILKEKIYI